MSIGGIIVLCQKPLGDPSARVFEVFLKVSQSVSLYWRFQSQSGFLVEIFGVGGSYGNLRPTRGPKASRNGRDFFA